MSDWLLKNGTIVDGTGAKPFDADVRVVDGCISEVAPELQPRDGEVVYDASGCYVSPGFIESHTHFDGTAWWEPELKPLAGFGATTVIMGNCGFTVAPVSDDPKVREEMIGIFSFFEDIPEAPFRTELPWDWSSWPEYKQSMEKHVKLPTNYAIFVGHIALRLAVMGLDAWEREATADEIAAMATALEEALDAGALGLSSNLLDNDGSDRPVPSKMASDAEWVALATVIANRPGASLQVIVDTFRNMEAPAQMERFGEIFKHLKGLRVQWAGLPTLVFQRDLMGIQAPLEAIHEKFKQEGRDYWTGYAHVPITATAGLRNSLVFAQSNDYVWHEVVLADSDEAKNALLQDADWRVRAQRSWEQEVFDFSPLNASNAHGIQLLNSANDVGPIRITLGEYAEQLGLPLSDAMAEWFLINGLDSTVTLPPMERDEDMLGKLFHDPKSVGNISDAGAHGQMLCGAGENIMLLTEFVRDTGRLAIEEAVHVMSGKLADHFGLTDRGVIATGKRADITVFDMNEIQYQHMEKTFDVPDGKGGKTWRWTRQAAPMRLTMVNGQATFQDGEYTSHKPGEFLSPGALQATA